ncbi:MAG: tetratricopeptide repeat protein [Candidatus Bruticola sp.]
MDQACREFKLALKFDPNHKEACYNMALMQYKTGDFEGAKATLRRCSEIDSQDPATRVMISLLQ